MGETAKGTNRWRTWAFPAAVVIVLGAIAIYWWASSAGGGSRLPVVRDAAPFSFEDVDGNTVTLENTGGKVRLLYFFFSYCPDVCPPTTFLLSQVQNRLKDLGVFGDKTMLLSVTIDPERDTPERLREYAGKFDADFSGWKFLRGEERATADLAKQYDILVTKDSEGNFGHSNLYILIDQDGKIRKWISVSGYLLEGDLEGTLDGIIGDIRSLL